MITVDHIRNALQLKNFDVDSAQAKMAPLSRRLRPTEHDDPPRQAGVLALFYPDEEEMLQLVLTRRTDNLHGHSGQISFPGGRRDPDDESLIATALRETCEELGICDQTIDILGQLSSIYIPPSNFDVHPTVAVLDSRPAFVPSPAEVAEVIPFPIINLLKTESKAVEDWEFRGQMIPIPFYQIGGHKVWGATAVMLSELEYRLRAILPRSILGAIDA